MKGELYDYKGQKLTQAEIARLEGINRATLADWYKKTNDMEKAVEGAKKSLAQRNIQYYDEVLSLKAISNKEQLKFESLKRYYDETQDIYKAVQLAKESQFKRNGSIEYNGQMLTILGISKLEQIDSASLQRHFKQTGNIYEAVKLTKKAKELHNGTILYKGKIMSISKIAIIENIKRETLNEFYEIYGDIEKAVFITKESQIKRKQALYKGQNKTYSDISKQLGISTINLDKLIRKGKSIEEIESNIKKTRIGKKSNEYLQYKGESLYKFCLENSYNYWVINYMINTYGKTVEESIETYIENGQQIPTKWIYEKYSILFKHLLLSFGIDSNKLIRIMKEENCTVEEAATKLIFISNNQNNNLKLIEIDWLYELYNFLSECTQEERKNAIETFYLTERELKFLNEKDDKIQRVKRGLLLFEFSEIIEETNIHELNEMFDIYGISNEEIIFIFTELYKPFNDNIINPNPEILERKQYLNSLIINFEKDLDYENLNLSSDELLYVKNKKEKLNQIMDIREETKDFSKGK